MVSQYLYVFTFAADKNLATRLAQAKLPLSDYGGVTAFVPEWPPLQADMDERISIFIQKDKVWVGKNTWATSHLNDWLADYTTRFVEKKLIEKTEQSAPIRNFIGRTELLEKIGQAITSDWQLKDNQKWLFSIWGQGGEGKSYVITQIHQTYSWRILFSQVDHQSPEQNEQGLVETIRRIADGLEKDGCPIFNFKDVHNRLLKVKKTSEQPISVDETSARIANKLSELGKKFEGFGENQLQLNPVELLKNAPTILNLIKSGGSVASELGLLYEAFEAGNDHILKSQPIQELTAALVKDITKFNQEQSQYYLWRRLVIAFDTYEQLGLLIDQWLRTQFLPSIRALRPVVIIAGRYSLDAMNTRWSDFQDEMYTERLTSFDKAQTIEYLREWKISDPQKVEEIWGLSEGLPLLINLIAKTGNPDQAIKRMTERILEEIPDDKRWIFLHMAVPYTFDRTIVGQILAKQSNTDTALQILTQASFVEMCQNQWQYLPIVRKVLLRHLELENPTLLAEIWRKYTSKQK